MDDRLKILVALASMLFFALGSAAQALTITTAVTTPDAAERTSGGGSYGSDDSGATAAVTASSVQSVTETIGETGGASGVYLTQAWADTTWGDEDHTYSQTLTTVFTIDTVGSGGANGGGLTYDVTFNTGRLGFLQTEDDTWSYSTVYSSAHLGVLSGTVNGASEAGLGLGALDYDPGSVGAMAVNQTSDGTATFSVTGNQVFTVITTWDVRVTSNYDESGVILGQSIDESWLDLERTTTVGEGVRTSMLVTVTPEPSTALLVGLGLAGLASRKRARSQR